MNTSQLIKLINESLATYGAGPLIPGETSGDDEKSVVSGTLSGRAVRVEFEVTSGRPDPGHTVALFDNQTGDQLGRGDSGANFADAISGYSWNGAVQAISELA